MQKKILTQKRRRGKGSVKEDLFVPNQLTFIFLTQAKSRNEKEVKVSIINFGTIVLHLQRLIFQNELEYCIDFTPVQLGNFYIPQRHKLYEVTA